MKRSRGFLGFGLGLAALGAFAMIEDGGHAVAAPDPAREPRKAASVFVQELHIRELCDVLTYPARVYPKVNTTILSENDGVVSRILVPLGHPVRKNQVIMTMQHTDPIYRYAPVQVISPVAGVVSAVDVTEGSQVAKGEKLGLVTDPAKIRVELEVPALDLSRLPVGMAGEFTIAGAPTPVAVRIAGISPFVDPTTGTANSELEVVKPAARGSAVDAITLSPGMLGEVTFKTNSRKGISIPDHALMYRADGTWVRVIDAGKSKAIAVKIGKKQRGMVEILSGLAEGQKLIERSSRYIADGEVVTVESDPSGGSEESRE